MEIANNTNTGKLSQIVYDTYFVNSRQSRAIQNKSPGNDQTEGFSTFTEKAADVGITLSAQGKSLSAKEKTTQESSSDKPATAADEAVSQTGEALNEEDQRQVEELKRRDAQVRAHEQAHMSASAGLVQGGASFTYENGPDGKRYAVGGEVSIDSSKMPDDPRANLAKAQKIRRAALAPSEPSATDRSVAASASRMEAEARLEMAREKQTDAKQGSARDEDFIISAGKQNESTIQDSPYQQKQNIGALAEQRKLIDFYI